ncbi:hypothetical protein LXA43DRAFT_1034660 [Ganoderma leucocontextum]|nr:hypothetical protein LXA43DRAFT_1034660 [Ganoderma leucocontextum]
MTSIHELFKRLHDEIWKQGKPFIENYQGVNILDRTVSWLGIQGLVLVRDEYLRIWEYIISLRVEAVATGRMFQDGLVVTGHPGIGKSMFSLYALGAALEAHIPVVVCQNTHFCHVFDATGVKEFALGRDDLFAAPCHALYLFDSYYDLHSPPRCFLGRSGVLVHTVGPGNWTNWKWTERSNNALFWIMGVWTRAEMQALQ